MPRNYDYSMYYYRRPSNQGFAKKREPGFFGKRVSKKRLFELGLMLCAAVLLVVLTTLIFLNLNLSSQHIILHAVSVESYNTQFEAVQAAVSIRARGGAGYVYFSKKYHVIAAVYLTADEAKAVAVKLVSFNAATIVMKFNLKIKFNGSAAQRHAIKDAVDTLAEHLKQLLAAAQEFDSGKIDNVRLSGTINHLKIEIESVLQQLNVITSTDKNSQPVVKLSNCLREYVSALQSALANTITSATAKVLYCAIIESAAQVS